MPKLPGDLGKPRDKATGDDLVKALYNYLHRVCGEDGFVVVTGFPLAVTIDADRRRALILTSAADHAAGDTALAETIAAVSEELADMGIPKDRALFTGHNRWSADGKFTRDFGLLLDRWLYETAPERVDELNRRFKKQAD